MIQPVRVVHYVNQFFGGIGGEEMAHVGVSLAHGVVGASRALQQGLGAQGTLRDQLVPTAGSLPPPPRHDDHYGFMTLSCLEY